MIYMDLLVVYSYPFYLIMYAVFPRQTLQAVYRCL